MNALQSWFDKCDDERVALVLLKSGKFEITEDDSVNFLEACENKKIEVVKVLIEHPAINLNIKDSYENSAIMPNWTEVATSGSFPA